MSKVKIKEKAKQTIDRLSEARARLILDFIEYLDEKESWEATQELLEDKNIVEAYEKAKSDLKEGRMENFIPWDKRNKSYLVA
ncbi:hypothetical protein HQ584_06535 [Patescibacteria group bacterium]|nr:hypothetical protein [Patescibacteria group bacterium]